MADRVGRGRFWRFFLGNLLAIPLLFGGFILARTAIFTPEKLLDAVAFLRFAPALLLNPVLLPIAMLPSVFMATRRLHDIGLPGKLAWLAFFCGLAAPFAALVTFALMMGAAASGSAAMNSNAAIYFPAGAAFIFLLLPAMLLAFFCSRPGDPDENQYGPAPV